MLDIEKMTGQTLKELRPLLLKYLKNLPPERRPDDVIFGPPSAEQFPVYVRISGDEGDFFNWPDLDLNLMAVVVAAMDDMELFRFEMRMHRLYADTQGNDYGGPKYTMWLLTEGDKYRFLAALMCLGLATLREGEGT